MAWLGSHLREAASFSLVFSHAPIWYQFLLPRTPWTLCFPCFPDPIMPSSLSCSHPCQIYLGYPSTLLEILNIPFLLSLSHLLDSNGKISSWQVLDLGKRHHLDAGGDLLCSEQSFPGAAPSPGDLLKLGRVYLAQITWEHVPMVFSSGNTSVALYFH